MPCPGWNDWPWAVKVARRKRSSSPDSRLAYYRGQLRYGDTANQALRDDGLP